MTLRLQDASEGELRAQLSSEDAVAAYVAAQLLALKAPLSEETLEALRIALRARKVIRWGDDDYMSEAYVAHRVLDALAAHGGSTLATVHTAYRDEAIFSSDYERYIERVDPRSLAIQPAVSLEAMLMELTPRPPRNRAWPDAVVSAIELALAHHREVLTDG